jgi:hypothetical protein
LYAKKEENMETQTIDCKQKSISLSMPTRYFLESIQVIEFETKKTFYGDSELIRKAVDFYVTKKYPHLFNDVKEFIKE